MCKFRDLRADEIECRVQSVKDKGLVLLLYKDARVDMNILDEAVGSSNWQNKFYENKGILFCSLGINTNFDKPDLPDRWVWKDDAGVESNTEAEKGNASDARKRSGFAWGIGRELYTAPNIKIEPNELKSLKQDNSGKWKCYDKFKVQKIVIEKKRIVALAIWNCETKKTCYIFQDPVWKAEQEQKNV
jgi:hypothetical protein